MPGRGRGPARWRRAAGRAGGPGREPARGRARMRRPAVSRAAAARSPWGAESARLRPEPGRLRPEPGRCAAGAGSVAAGAGSVAAGAGSVGPAAGAGCWAGGSATAVEPSVVSAPAASAGTARASRIPMRSAPNQAAGPGLRRVRGEVIRGIASVTAVFIRRTESSRRSEHTPNRRCKHSSGVFFKGLTTDQTAEGEQRSDARAGRVRVGVRAVDQHPPQAGPARTGAVVVGLVPAVDRAGRAEPRGRRGRGRRSQGAASRRPPRR